MSVILMTTLFYKALILQGEIWCWSLLGLKGHLKSEFALSFKLYCVYFTSFNPTKVGDFFWRWILKDCIDRNSGREKENRYLVFSSSTKREIRYFQVVVVQRRQRNVRTSVMHIKVVVLLIWTFFEVSCSRCRRHRPARCLSSLKNPDTETVLFGNRFPGERSQIRIKICVFKNVWIRVRDMASAFF